MKKENEHTTIRVSTRNRKKLKVIAAQNDTDIDGALDLTLPNGKEQVKKS